MLYERVGVFCVCLCVCLHACICVCSHTCIHIPKQYLIWSCFLCRYICITLAESYIYHTLMTTFTQPTPPHYFIHIRGIHATTPSPFLPLMFVIHKTPSAPFHTHTVYISAFGERLRTPILLSHTHTQDHITSIQHYIRKTYTMRTLQVGRFDVLHIHSNNTHIHTHTHIPRFTLYVLDVTEHAMRNAAVFLVPQGRESEFMFSSQRGLRDIA
ncbi:hypothetical protein EON63_16565 [archaeon]|nr:MAG: hypothetical protein EON63_16565 [archaeon]